MVYIFIIKVIIWLNAQPVQLYICAGVQNVIRQANKVIGWNSDIVVPDVVSQQMAPQYVCMY